METNVSGSCLCGKVTAKIEGPFQRFYQCHCDRCQKKTGSSYGSMIFTSPDSIEWLSGEDSRKRYDLPNAERFSCCFCTECGCPTPYLSRDGNFLQVPAGFLDSDPQIRPSANIFWGERSCWFDEGQATDKFNRYPE